MLQRNFTVVQIPPRLPQALSPTDPPEPRPPITLALFYCIYCFTVNITVVVTRALRQSIRVVLFDILPGEASAEARSNPTGLSQMAFAHSSDPVAQVLENDRALSARSAS